MNTQQVVAVVNQLHVEEPAKFVTVERVERKLEQIDMSASRAMIKRAIKLADAR